MVMPEPAFIGIVLVQNEDAFLHRVVSNVLDFCDRIFIADHQSSDATFEIAQELARTHRKVEAHRIFDPRESNEMLQPFANTRAWVLGVDGDEIYDPGGLAEVRRDLVRGVWDQWWVIFGNVLNCTELDLTTRRARGWMAPPCRSMTKLYNFAAVQRLDPDSPQRLMGRHNVFNPGYDDLRRLDLYQSVAWEDARFRCLHACFLPRSSQESNPRRARENITELRRRSITGAFRRLMARLSGQAPTSRWKMEKYARGEIVTADVSAFFP